MGKALRWISEVLLAAVWTAVFLRPPLYAANGKIVGVVKDVSSGEPLPGANVVIVGTTMGASTDKEGRYFILNVPPGAYTLQATYVGYQTLQKSNVRVSLDFTTEVNFDLSSEVIELGKVVTVVAERPLVEKTLTQSRSTVGVQELDNTLPVADLSDIVETAASTFQGYIRGGRKYETKTLVDGVDVSETYFSGGTGAFGIFDVGHVYQGFRRSEIKETATVDVPTGAVQELSIYAGTFNAEYPTASAGIINLVTKSGGDKLHGKVFFRGKPLNEQKHFGSNVYWMKDSRGGNVGYFEEKQNYLNAGTDYGRRAASLYTWTEDLAVSKYMYDPKDSVGLGRSYEVEGYLNGPVPFLGTKAGFYLSLRYQKMRPTPLPFDEDKRVTGSLKLHYDLKPHMRLTAYGQVEDGGKLFNFVNWKFNPKWAYYMEGAPRYKDVAGMGYLKWTHTINPKTFYEVQISQNNKTDWIGYPDDDGDGKPEIDEKGDFIDFDNIDEYVKYVGGVIEPDTIKDAAGNVISIGRRIKPRSQDGYVAGHFGDPNYRVFFYETIDPRSGVNEAKANFYKTDGTYRTAYPAPLYSKTTRNVSTIKADLTSQVTYTHQVKAGVQFRYHHVDVNHLQSELGGAGNKYPTSVFHVDFHRFFPKEFAVYTQDRVEYKGLIINVGGRVDAYDTDTRRFKNDFHPWNVVYNDPKKKELIELQPVRGEKVGWKWFFSPRVGVSHPVKDNMAMHYSFGKFIQYPNFASLYEDYNFTNYAASPEIATKWVNQEPMRSTSYEMGLQYAPLAELGLDVSVYYRDVENYGTLSYLLTPYAGQGLRLYTSWGHADSRGIEVSLDKRPGRWWAGRVTYSYAYIKAASFVGGLGQRTSFSSKTDSARVGELPFDQIGTFNYRELNITERSTNNALAGGFDRTHRFAASILFFAPYGFQLSSVAEVMSGFKYYPIENVDNDPYFQISPKLKEGPWNWWVNLRATKEFVLPRGTRARLFGEVRNLFDHKNVIAYNNTPFNEATDQRIFEIGRDFKPKTGDEQDPEGYRKVPHDWFGRLLYGPAREFWAGLEFSF